MGRVTAMAFALAVLVGAAEAQAAANVGEAAPEITAQYWLNTPPLSLQALRGKIAVVEFWATWCGPCRASIPHLIEIHKKYSGKGVVIVSLTDEPRSKVEPFAKQMGMVYPVGGGSQAGSLYGVTGIPHAFIVDPSGKIAWAGHPMAGLDAALESQLTKTPPVLVSPKAKAAAVEALDLAEKALKEGKFAEASAQLAKATDVDDEEVRNRSAAVRAALGEAATKALAEAETQLEAKQYYEASEALRKVPALFPGSDQARQAEKKLADLTADADIRSAIEKARGEREAQALMERIRQEEGGKEPAVILKGLEHVATKYPDTPAGKEAAARAEAMRNDKQLMARINEANAEKECKGWLSLARNYIQAGLPEKAEPYLRNVVEKYGRTEHAAEAQKMLKEIGRE